MVGTTSECFLVPLTLKRLLLILNSLESYELGFKYNSDDNRLRANAALFFMDYSDLQIAVVNNSVDVVTRNAGEPRSRSN